MLQANTAPQQVGSVEFIFDGHLRRTENKFPYEFILPALKPGTHTVRTEVYSKAHKQGEQGVGLTATITVINSAAVISFDVVNASGKILMSLHDGDKINVGDPRFKAINIIANTKGPVGSVSFWINNQYHRTENVVPYTLAGDQNGFFYTWQPPIGQYKLSAIPYSGQQAQGAVGKPLSIHFKVVNQPNQLARISGESAPGQGLSVFLYPVPVDNELHVKIDDLAGGDALVIIRNIHGQTVYQGSYSKSQEINTSDLAAGVYFLQITGNGGFQKVVKFMKN